MSNTPVMAGTILDSTQRDEEKIMRILVTGGTGFVGKALVARLQERGDTVAVVSRTPDSARNRLGIEDAYSWDDLAQAIDTGFDAVVHLAGESVKGFWSKAKTAEVWDSRIWTSQSLVAAIQASNSPPSVLVFASGVGFYGDAGETELPEESSPGDDYFARLCVEWEALANSLDRSDVRVACARFGIVLGVDGGALASMLLPAKSGFSGPLGSGRQWWSWISLKDAVSTLVHIIDQATIEGPVNVVSPHPIRQADFQKVLCGALGRPAFMPAPAFAVRALLGRFAQEVLSSKRVTPGVLRRTGFEWADSDLSTLFSRLLSRKGTAVILPMIAALALLAAPYGKTPHVVTDVSLLMAGEGTISGLAHAGFHCMGLMWLLAVLTLGSL